MTRLEGVVGHSSHVGLSLYHSHCVPISALLDYVSRAHEIEIRPSSVRPSSVRVAIISEPNGRISFKFHLWRLLDYLQRQFKKKTNIFRFR